MNNPKLKKINGMIKENENSHTNTLKLEE